MQHEEYLKEIKKPLMSLALKRGYHHYEVEDIYQDYCLYVVRGKGAKQTLEQFLVDWTRKKLGRYGQRLNINQMIPCSRFEWGQVVKHLKSDDDPEYHCLVNQIMSKLSPLDKKIFYLHFICNFEIKTIANGLGVAYSAVFFHFKSLCKQCREILSD